MLDFLFPLIMIFSSIDDQPFCDKFSTAIRIFAGTPFICTYFDTEDALRQDKTLLSALSKTHTGIEYSAKIPKTINWLHSIGKFLLFAQNHGNAAKTRKIL